MHSDASARHASISQTFENSSGSMHAPPNLTVDALGAPERAWPLPWSSRPLDQPSCSFVGVRRRKSYIPSFDSLMLLSITCVKSDKFRAKAPENQSAPLFSRSSSRNESADQGDLLLRCGLSAGAKNRGKLWMLGPHNEPSSLARRASGGGIYAGSEELNFND